MAQEKGNTNKRKSEDDLKLRHKKSKSEYEEDEDSTESNTEGEDESINSKQNKVKLKQKSKLDTEESDAIETDFQEDQILTPQDLFLMDLTDCDTPKAWKKRVVSLFKAINARTKRLEKVEAKIQNIEEKGLNSRNKKFHTAMHTEKLVLEERMQKLRDVLDVAQGKLKELDIELDKDYKKKNEKSTIGKSDSKKKEKKESKAREKPESKGKRKMKTQLQENTEPKNSENDEVTVKEDDKNVTQKKVKKKEKVKNMEIDIIEDLQPVVVVPSAKEFWSADPVSLTNKVQEESSSSSEEEVIFFSRARDCSVVLIIILQFKFIAFNKLFYII